MGAIRVAGAVKDTIIWRFPPDKSVITGPTAGGLYNGTTTNGFASADTGELPTGVPATTLILYETSFVNPVAVAFTIGLGPVLTSV